MKSKKGKWSLAFEGLCWVVLGLILDTIVQMSILISPALKGAFNIPETGWITGLITFIAELILGAIAIWIMVLVVRRASPKLGFHRFRKEKANWIWRGYLLIIAVGMATSVLQRLFAGHLATPNNQLELEKLAHGGPSRLVFVMTLGVLVAPILEELIFRGVIMNYFFKSSGWWVNVILSGLLFGYFHVVGGTFSFFALLQYAGMGVVLAVVYKKTKQIQYSITVHMLNNAVAMLILLFSVLSH